MTLKEEKIQDDPIRGTPEIGRRGTYSIACLRLSGSRPLGSRSDRNIPSRRCCVRFSYRMVPEVYQMFWAGWRLGSSSTMPQSRPVVIASKAPAGWLRWEVLDLVGPEPQGSVSNVGAAGGDRARPGPR